jgi:hypothetical protein
VDRRYNMKKAREGRKFIDVDEMIAKAATPEEKEAWEANRELLDKVDFVEDWYVDIYKHACGHWEVLQTPVYAGRTIEETKAEMDAESAKRKCTSCVCNWGREA